MSRIKYNHTKPGERRKHYLEQQDVEVLLDRLPPQVWSRLRAVHFNDEARGNRCLGYVNRGHREIAICALPPNVSLSRCLFRHSPRPFGAVRGFRWPETAVRRFLLYDVFLHELGHLQIVDSNARSLRRRFASETKAQEFANRWRDWLWAEHFSHPDPIHNPASPGELEMLQHELQSHAKHERVVTG